MRREQQVKLALEILGEKFVFARKQEFQPRPLILELWKALILTQRKKSKGKS